jgi:pilus assembly protein CpaB
MRRRILILLTAAVLAGISALSVVAYGRTADRRALEGKQGTWVLLATGTIPADTRVADIRARRLVRQVLMPVEAVPDGALSRLDTSIDELRLNATLMPDQMLLSGQFTVAGAETAPSPAPTFALPADRLAVSVTLGMAAQVAGNLENGDKVTVFLTYPKEPSATEKQTTVVLLPKATVISVGERSAAANAPTVSVSPSPGDLAPTVMDATPAVAEQLERYVATLAVTQQEAEALILGSSAGLLHLGMLGAKASVSPAPSLAEVLASAGAGS